MGIRVPLQDFQPRNITHIVVHHSAELDTRLEDFDSIYNYHVNVLGWIDIGYHAVVEIVGASSIAQYARPEHVVGAHTRGYNAETLGVCIVGNYSLAAPSLLLLNHAARRVVAPWCVQYSVPVENVLGHSEITGGASECPGLMFDMNLFRDIVNGYILRNMALPDEGGDSIVPT